MEKALRKRVSSMIDWERFCMLAQYFWKTNLLKLILADP